MHTRMNEGHFYSPPPPMSGDNNVYVVSGLISPILRIGDQVLTFDVFWPKHLQEVRSTAYIHVQSI